MQLETIWLCRDLDVMGVEWSLISVTRKFSQNSSTLCMAALVSGLGPGAIVPFKVDLFRISHLGGESILAKPTEYELEIKSAWPQILAVRIVIDQRLIPGDYYASPTLLDCDEVVPFSVEKTHAA